SASSSSLGLLGLGRQDDSVVLLLEPLDGLVTVDLVGRSDTSGGSSALGDTAAGAVEHDVEVHSVDSDGGVVLDSQIDVLLDSESEVSVGREVLAVQLVFLDLESLVDDLLGLRPTDGAVNGDLLVSADTERTDGVTGLGEHGGLASELLEHLSGTGKSVSRLPDADVEAELLNLQLAHGILCLLLADFRDLFCLTH
ncbi:hypothetical protein PFISCL1PPCAC_24774, partial [Pristionchus fissidentatus]